MVRKYERPDLYAGHEANIDVVLTCSSVDVCSALYGKFIKQEKSGIGLQQVM